MVQGKAWGSPLRSGMMPWLLFCFSAPGMYPATPGAPDIPNHTKQVISFFFSRVPCRYPDGVHIHSGQPSVACGAKRSLYH
jgi:hypothetical protein